MDKRLTRAELGEMLLRAGSEILLEDGMRCGLDHVTLPRVFERIERETGRRVTRASVYDRLWSSQEEFQFAVLTRVVCESGSIDEGTRRRIDDILAAADRSSPAGRYASLRKLCQLAVEHHVIEASKRQHYHIVMAAVGAIASSEQPDGEPTYVTEVRNALREYLETETSLYLDLYNMIGASLGFRLRDPLELRHFVLAIGALGEGIAIRLNFFPEYAERIRVPPADGFESDETWSLAGLGVEAIARSMLELDPDWEPPDEEAARASSVAESPA